jgi:anti-sigma B factor antagonist
MPQMLRRATSAGPQMLRRATSAGPRTSSAFACEVIPERGRVRVAPVGELDLAAAPELDRTVRELWRSGFRAVVLDLRGVCFLDVSGLRLILELDAVARSDSSSFALIAGGRNVQRVFTLTGCGDRLRFESARR